MIKLFLMLQFFNYNSNKLRLQQTIHIKYTFLITYHWFVIFLPPVFRFGSSSNDEIHFWIATVLFQTSQLHNFHIVDNWYVLCFCFCLCSISILYWIHLHFSYWSHILKHCISMLDHEFCDNIICFTVLGQHNLLHCFGLYFIALAFRICIFEFFNVLVLLSRHWNRFQTGSLFDVTISCSSKTNKFLTIV